MRVHTRVDTHARPGARARTRHAEAERGVWNRFSLLATKTAKSAHFPISDSRTETFSKEESLQPTRQETDCAFRPFSKARGLHREQENRTSTEPFLGQVHPVWGMWSRALRSSGRGRLRGDRVCGGGCSGWAAWPGGFLEAADNRLMASTWEDVKAHGSLDAVFGCDRHQAIRSRARRPLQHPLSAPTLGLRQASLSFLGLWRSSLSVCRGAAHGAGRQGSKPSQDP
uniref:uncharacterized protein LOC118534054 n=1 Tax=Halichoerus grypus TaxID=9711 RepID=UPI0016594539|nr:uncharacterized protein LOC118534054 [Halichoerus grypus]